MHFFFDGTFSTLGAENGSQIVEVHLEELDEDTRKLVEREVVKASLPQNYKQTLGNDI